MTMFSDITVNLILKNIDKEIEEQERMVEDDNTGVIEGLKRAKEIIEKYGY